LKRSLWIFCAGILLFLVIGTASAIWLRSELETPYLNAPGPEVFINVPKGARTRDIADLLSNQGVLHSRLAFVIYMRSAGIGRRIQAGEYRFARPATPRQVAQRLIRGDVYFRSVTIPEGLTANETVELLARNGLGEPAGLQMAILNTTWIKELDPGAQNLEGYLFPETYRFGHQVDSETVIRTMVNQFKSRFAKITAQSPVPAGLNISKAVTLASMIEKEVKKPEERPLVASVLLNRLQRGMPLACDATIIYALKLAGTYHGRIRKADLAIESPYNSYLHMNLPPGPIANPGAASLRAALNPARTDYLYYVSRNDGTHQFSKDLNTHLHAVDRFQKSVSGRRSSLRK
jgi:UPF0755 protein